VSGASRTAARQLDRFDARPATGRMRPSRRRWINPTWTWTKPRNRCLSGAELEVRIRSAPAKSHANSAWAKESTAPQHARNADGLESAGSLMRIQSFGRRASEEGEMKAYHIDRFGSIGGIVRRSAEDPRPGPKEVLMRVPGKLLNHGDLIVLKGGGRGPTWGASRAFEMRVGGFLAQPSRPRCGL